MDAKKGRRDYRKFNTFSCTEIWLDSRKSFLPLTFLDFEAFHGFGEVCLCESCPWIGLDLISVESHRLIVKDDVFVGWVQGYVPHDPSAEGFLLVRNPFVRQALEFFRHVVVFPHLPEPVDADFPPGR